ncbi:hypothetical protein B0H14DRAFT_3043888 [Mycena olivaceomarginata]|nr:hypothetical protein B0H14DRAFT_3043888 [Mycena olivaceomarginata]
MLRRSSAVPSFASALSRNPGLPRFGGNKDLASDTFSADKEGLISWNAFEAMAQCSGSTLRECFTQIHTYQVASANIFAGLTALRTLIWNSSTTFLEASTSFMTVLSQMKLPSLRRVILSCDSSSSEIFLETHGPKLTPNFTFRSRVLKVCPNLRSFSILGMPMISTLSEPIMSLVGMIFEASSVRRNMYRFFTELNTESLPNLREIWVENCEWPTGPIDRTGTKWRSRLQVK